MRKLFLIFIVGLLQINLSHSQNAIEWALNMKNSIAGSTMMESARDIQTDSFGNLYLVGVFQGIIDSDPSSQTKYLTSNGAFDIFVSKFDKRGNLIWANSFGGSGNEDCFKIKLINDSNLFIVGHYNATVNFNPSSNGISTYTSVGQSDIFVVNFDANGRYKWSKSIGGTTVDVGNCIAFDSNNNFYLAGYFTGNTDFDPSSNVVNLPTPITYDTYIAKYNFAGNLIWVNKITGTNNNNAQDIIVDKDDNVLLLGSYQGSIDCDPSTYTVTHSSVGSNDIFIAKYNSNGNYTWSKSIGSGSADYAYSIKTTTNNDFVITGMFRQTADFDPSINTQYYTSVGAQDIFLGKYNSNGDLIWVKTFGGADTDCGKNLVIDKNDNIYLTGYFFSTTDLDPSTNVSNYISVGSADIFYSKYDINGEFIFAETAGSINWDEPASIVIDSIENIFVCGTFSDFMKFNTINTSASIASINSNDLFVFKSVSKGVVGEIFNDIIENCNIENEEKGLANRKAIINPGNKIVYTNNNGIWLIDSLPVGNYSIFADTSGYWKKTCPYTQFFSITNPENLTVAPNFGFISQAPCSKPNVSITMPQMRRCFTNQNLYIKVSNESEATSYIKNGYIELELDSLVIVETSATSYTYMGNNKYKIYLQNDSILPGISENIMLSCKINCSAQLGQTLCMKANLFPIDSCALDTTPSIIKGVSECNLPWDKSSLKVKGSCVLDSIRFVVTNHGSGDMQCYLPIRIFVDGIIIKLDSIKLESGDSIVYTFLGDGRTWRLEADQHPLHPGKSKPNASVENCNAGNWTSNLINVLPQDDADPVSDIFCGQITGSYDPNDKTGYPLGVSLNRKIAPNLELFYLINFQNTGNDTAFNVVIRDTLDFDLDIFSVKSSVSSHNYTFKMQGPRVLEWYFYNILLPDSTTDEPNSKGFITFMVSQNKNLVHGTKINNHADIYFDFNEPIITNTTLHTIDDSLNIIKPIINNEVNGIGKLIANENILIIPNPNNGEFTISTNNINSTFIITDIAGRLVKIGTISTNKTDVNLNEVKTGIYFLKVDNHSHKIIKL